MQSKDRPDGYAVTIIDQVTYVRDAIGEGTAQVLAEDCIKKLDAIRKHIKQQDIDNIDMHLRYQDEVTARFKMATHFGALYEACKAFVIAHERSHQLEKTDVALRMAKAAIEKVEAENADKG